MKSANLFFLSVFAFFVCILDAKAQTVNYDLEATEVVSHDTDTGERYFSYLVTNVGSTTAPAESYEVFLTVNRKMVSLDTKTSALEPGKSLLYTSEHKFQRKKSSKDLKYKLIIKTKDANKENNKLTGVVKW